MMEQKITVLTDQASNQLGIIYQTPVSLHTIPGTRNAKMAKVYFLFLRNSRLNKEVSQVFWELWIGSRPWHRTKLPSGLLEARKISERRFHVSSLETGVAQTDEGERAFQPMEKDRKSSHKEP